MSHVAAYQPLVSLAMPESKAARFLVKGGLVVAGTLLLTLSAHMKVVLGPVDLSLQTLVVMLIGATFGLRLGVATVVLYLAQGLYGLPVFQGTPEKGLGLVYMAGPTGGFLAGFIVMAAIAGFAADRGWDRNPVKLFGMLLVSTIALFAMGFSWLATLIGVQAAWNFGVAPFILVDLIKVALASCIIPAGWSTLKMLNILR